MYLDVWSHEQKQSIRNGHAILASQMLIKQAGTKVKDEFSMHAAKNNCHLNFDNNDLETAISIQHYHYNFKGCLFNTQRKQLG